MGTANAPRADLVLWNGKVVTVDPAVQEQRLIKFHRRRILHQYFDDLTGYFGFDIVKELHRLDHT